MADTQLRLLERRAMQTEDVSSQTRLQRWWLKLGRGWHGEDLPSGLRPLDAPGLYAWNGGRGGPVTMRFVPRGAFLMGSTEPRDAEYPPRSVEIDYGYWIADRAINPDQFRRFSRTRPIHQQLGLARPGQPALVRWSSADAYCRWLGLRLPTEEEWEKAAGTLPDFLASAQDDGRSSKVRTTRIMHWCSNDTRPGLKAVRCTERSVDELIAWRFERDPRAYDVAFRPVLSSRRLLDEELMRPRGPASSIEPTWGNRSALWIDRREQPHRSR